MDSIPRRLDVHPRVASQLQPDLPAALEGAIGEHSPQLRQQRRERQFGSRGKPSRPERLGELVTAGDSIAIDGEIREQEAALAAGQLLLDSPAGHSGDEAPAELNSSPLSLWLRVGHSAKLPPTPTRDNP